MSGIAMKNSMLAFRDFMSIKEASVDYYSIIKAEIIYIQQGNYIKGKIRKLLLFL